MMAASVASLIPMPDAAAAAPAKQKKQRTANHPPSDPATTASGDPGQTAPAAALAAPAVTVTSFSASVITVTPPAPPVAQDRYPWKREIVTTTFWIGEKPAKNNPVPNNVSSWDAEWAKHYGGTDSPDKDDRTDYRPAAFIPGQNPFYVALPYNDIQAAGHKPEAASLIPWFKADYQGPGKTVCKGRWLAIRFKDRVTYAQWEDCGPFRTDHSSYVFGNERPKPNLNKGAGLDVSPAVRDYLGMNDTDVTDWKFVDFDEVPPGPWAKYGDNNTFVINQRLKEERTAALTNGKVAPR